MDEFLINSENNVFNKPYNNVSTLQSVEKLPRETYNFPTSTQFINPACCVQTTYS